jgi:hypothetical protein
MIHGETVFAAMLGGLAVVIGLAICIVLIAVAIRAARS